MIHLKREGSRRDKIRSRDDYFLRIRERECSPLDHCRSSILRKHLSNLPEDKEFESEVTEERFQAQPSWCDENNAEDCYQTKEYWQRSWMFRMLDHTASREDEYQYENRQWYKEVELTFATSREDR